MLVIFKINDDEYLSFQRFECLMKVKPGVELFEMVNIPYCFEC